MDVDLKTALEDQGKAFEAFKKSHEEQIAELKKSGSNDPILLDRLGKIEKSLDIAVEAKAAIDSAIAAERKHVDEIEKRLNKEGIKGTGESAVRELEIKTFNRTLGALAKQRGQGFSDLDAKSYDDY